jgi:hypothetical protein
MTFITRLERPIRVDRAGCDAHMATEPFKENILGKVVPMLESRVRDFYETAEP